MNAKYKLRFANKNDVLQIEELVRDMLAERNSLMQPDMVNSDFVKDFVAKIVLDEEMLIVENSDKEIELIGEKHNFSNNDNPDEIVELAFYSNVISNGKKCDTELVDWLYSEVYRRHENVFRVEVTTSVSNDQSLEMLEEKGVIINGRTGNGASVKGKNARKVMPMFWFNPSFKSS